MNIRLDPLLLFQMDVGQWSGEGNVFINVLLMSILFSQPCLCPYFRVNTTLDAVS
jgi:hypothetical protein